MNCVPVTVTKPGSFFPEVHAVMIPMAHTISHFWQGVEIFIMYYCK
jgi:hypothetical protein